MELMIGVNGYDFRSLEWKNPGRLVVLTDGVPVFRGAQRLVPVGKSAFDLAPVGEPDFYRPDFGWTWVWTLYERYELFLGVDAEAHWKLDFHILGEHEALLFAMPVRLPTDLHDAFSPAFDALVSEGLVRCK